MCDNAETNSGAAAAETLAGDGGDLRRLGSADALWLTFATATISLVAMVALARLGRTIR